MFSISTSFDKSPRSIKKTLPFFNIDLKFLTALKVSILNILFLFFSNLLNLIISFTEFVKDKAKKFILNFLLISIASKSFFVK